MAQASASRGHDFKDITIPGSGRAHLGNYYQGPVYNGTVYVYNTTSRKRSTTSRAASFDFASFRSVLNKTFEAWDSACGHYTEVTPSLDRLRTITTRVEAAASNPASVLIRTEQDMNELHDVLSRSARTVREVELLLARHEACGLSKSREKNWKNIQPKDNEVDRLSSSLQEHAKELSIYMSKVGLASTLAGILETHLHALPEQIQQSIDAYAAQVRTGAKEGSIMTAYEGDERHVWREVRRELFGDGFTSEHLHRYKPQIKRYLRSLTESGQLSEDETSDLTGTVTTLSIDASRTALRTDSTALRKGKQSTKDNSWDPEQEGLEPRADDISADSGMHLAGTTGTTCSYLPPYCESADEDDCDAPSFNALFDEDDPILQMADPKMPVLHAEATATVIEGQRSPAVNAWPAVTLSDCAAEASRMSCSLKSAKLDDMTGPPNKHESLGNQIASASELSSTDIAHDPSDINVRQFRVPRIAGYRDILHALGYPYLVEASTYLILMALSRRQREGITSWYESRLHVLDSDIATRRDERVEGDIFEPGRWMLPQRPHVDAGNWTVTVGPWPGLQNTSPRGRSRTTTKSMSGAAHCWIEDSVQERSLSRASVLAHCGDALSREQHMEPPVLSFNETINVWTRPGEDLGKPFRQGTTVISKFRGKIEALQDLGWPFEVQGDEIVIKLDLEDHQYDELCAVSRQYDDRGMKHYPLLSPKHEVRALGPPRPTYSQPRQSIPKGKPQ